MVLLRFTPLLPLSPLARLAGLAPALLALAASLPSSAAFATFAGSDAAASADRNATLNLLSSSYPKTLNPVIASTADEMDIVSNSTIFEQLTATDPDTGEAVCWLCESYAYDPADKKIVTFKLRKDAKFHDGRPLTAADVKFSYDVMLHPKVDNLNQKSAVMAVISKVEVIDDYTLRFTFKGEKYANIYQMGVPVIPKHLFPYFEKTPEQFNRDQKFGRAPTGSGPYKFVKWQGDKFVELERNEEWWGFTTQDPRFKNAFNFKKIRYKVITNTNVATQAFKKGDFDFTTLQSFEYEDLLKNGKGLKVEPIHLEPEIGTSFMMIGWNARLPMFSDVKTRAALELLTDRPQTLKKFSKGLRPPTNGPWGIKSPYQCPPERCPVAPFDPAQGKKLLAEAGWADTDKDGCLDRTAGGAKQTLKFAVLTGEDEWSKNVLSVYTTEMQKAGVCATIRQLDWTAMTKLVDDLNFEAYVSGWRAGYPVLPRQLFHSENIGKTGSNAVAFVDKDADKLIEAFEAEFDADKRKAIGRELHERIYKAHPMVWHHEGGGCYVGRSKGLLGVALAPYDPSCVFWPRWYKAKS